MKASSRAHAPRKATNVSIDAELLGRARALNLNLSQTLEKALTEVVLKEEQNQWRRDNQLAIDNYNRRVAEHGCFGDELRSF